MTRIRGDVVAGLTTAAVVLPKAMAYAAVAGLPLQVGLYPGIVPVVAYAAFGTSRTLSATSTSTLAILTAASSPTWLPLQTSPPPSSSA